MTFKTVKPKHQQQSSWFSKKHNLQFRVSQLKLSSHIDQRSEDRLDVGPGYYDPIDVHHRKAPQLSISKASKPQHYNSVNIVR
jgi:hypothetical protein